MKNILAVLLLFTTVILASCKKEESPPPVSGVTINKTTLALIEGAKETLTATVLPDNATDKGVIWSSSNTSIATVSATGEISAMTMASNETSEASGVCVSFSSGLSDGIVKFSANKVRAIAAF